MQLSENTPNLLTSRPSVEPSEFESPGRRTAFWASVIHRGALEPAHKLEDYAQAKLELEKCAETAAASYIKEARLWECLESTCRHLGLDSEAEHYAQFARPS